MTREFGATKVAESSGEANESDTVMRFLEGEDEIETRYGGGYVKSIDGASKKAERGGHPYDWFFYVNGVELADRRGRGARSKAARRSGGTSTTGRRASSVPAVVGSWPAPFTTGWEGHAPVVVVECEGGGAACGTVTKALEERRREGRASKGRGAEGGDPGAGRAVGEAALRPGGGAARKGPGRKRHLRRLRIVRRAAGRLVGLDEDGDEGAHLRRGRGAGRGDAPLRRAAGLAGHRRDGRGACRRPPRRSTPPTCATITRWRAKRGR